LDATENALVHSLVGGELWSICVDSTLDELELVNMGLGVGGHIGHFDGLVLPLGYLGASEDINCSWLSFIEVS
jgi:hypothetical protein